MKKILLIYPQISLETDTKNLYIGLPLSILTLAAQFDPNDYEIKVLDGRIKFFDLNDMADWLEKDVVCVGISAITSSQIKSGLCYAEAIRNINEKIPLVWGGWHPSLMPEQTIKHPLVDIILVGQGETVLQELVNRLERSEDLTGLHNIWFKNNEGKIIKTEQKYASVFPESKPVNRAYRYVNMSNYIQPLWGNNRVLGYESSRGCPNCCKFCSVGSLYNGRWDCFTADRTVEEIKFLKDTYQVDAVHFYDNNFFVNFKRVVQICTGFIEKDIKLKWDGTAVVEQFINLSEQTMRLLKESGFFRAIIGVESGDEDVLKKIGKKHNNGQVIELVKKCRDNHIMPSLSFMLGFPWEPEKDVYETVKLIEKIKEIEPHTEILLFVFSPYLGTKLFDTAVDYGMVFPDSLIGWAGYTYDKINVPWINYKLARKIGRYIQFFGTKEISDDMLRFVRGGIR